VSFFVDVHSHVVPSGDDGVQSVGEGRNLCIEAFRRGTAVLYATPHVWPHFTLDEERERQVREAHAEIAAHAGLELRLGFELTPAPPLLEEDLGRYVLEGTDAVLIEVPFAGGADLFFAVCEHAASDGLQVVVAHPERTESVLDNPSVAARAVEQGWVLQVNSTSLLGRHGPEIEALAWQFVDDGLVGLVGSDGHRAARPPFLEDAYRAVVTRMGETRARSLFDGSAIGVASTRALPSRAAARGA
jgi:protein-tyrosine phosphatase